MRDITDDDVRAEGVVIPPTELFPLVNTESKLVKRFEWLWDSLNAKRGYGWDTNPWVWVIEFKRIAPPAGEEEA